MTNSCSIFVDVDLIWDTYVANDVVYEDGDFICADGFIHERLHW